MPDGKQSCANCPHPLAEHAEIEGLENRGHCKVPGCPCGAFTTSGGEQAAEQKTAPAFHTIIARATNAEGAAGIEIKIPQGEGRPIDVPQEVVESAMVEARAQFEKVFGESASHAGVSVLPFLASADAPPTEVNVPLIQFGEDATAQDALEVLKEIDALKLPIDQMPPSVALAFELREVDPELTFEVLKGDYDDKESREVLISKLGEIDSPSAYLLARRIDNGEFDG
jgi:hypothetical protein